MNKKIILLGSAGLLILLGGLAVWFLQDNNGQTAGELASTAQPETAEVAQESGVVSKLKDVLKPGQSMKCTWRVDDDNYGTAYTKDEKVFTQTSVMGKQMNTIVADDCSYSWETGSPEGVKFCYVPEETAEEEEIQVTDEAFTWENQDISYQCAAASVDDSKFVPPDGVDFVGIDDFISEDVMEMMPEGMEGMVEMAE